MHVDKLTGEVIDEIIGMAYGKKTTVDAVKTINFHIDKFVERPITRDEVVRYVGSYIRKHLSTYDGADLVASGIESKILQDMAESKPEDESGVVMSEKGYRYGLDRVVEVREARSPEEANALLADGWRLLQVNGRFFLLARFEG